MEQLVNRAGTALSLKHFRVTMIAWPGDEDKVYECWANSQWTAFLQQPPDLSHQRWKTYEVEEIE